jgi:gamma-glutamylaminecyclotransferase
MSPDLVFVYGSLKRGFRNHGLLANCEFVGAGLTEARYRLINLGPYPALVETADEPLSITGELYRIDRATLSTLDRLEDEGVLYRRIVAPITGLEGGACDQRIVTHRAWTYLWLKSPSAYPLWPTATWVE